MIAGAAELQAGLGLMLIVLLMRLCGFAWRLTFGDRALVNRAASVSAFGFDRWRGGRS